MIHVILAVLFLWFDAPAIAAEAPADDPVMTQVAPQPQPYRRPAFGFRLGTGLGLTLGGLGVASFVLAYRSAAVGSGIGVAVYYLGGTAALVSGSLFTNLSTWAQAHNVGARPTLAKIGLIVLAGSTAALFLGAGGAVTLLAFPVVLGSSLVLGALQGHRNVEHARSLRVAVAPQLYRGGGYGLGLVASF